MTEAAVDVHVEVANETAVLCEHSFQLGPRQNSSQRLELEGPTKLAVVSGNLSASATWRGSSTWINVHADRLEIMAVYED